MTTLRRPPESKDGRIIDVQPDGDERLKIRIEFPMWRSFRELAPQHSDHIRFAARSRLARLGIDISPIGGIELEQDRAFLNASVRAVISSYNIGHLLEGVFLRDLLVGRLTICPPEARLSSEQLYQAYSDHAFQLPADFSIASDGMFTIHPHRLVYRLAKQLTEDDLTAILVRAEGKEILNRLQIPHEVSHIELAPGDGIVTSCTMYLHRHYVVLESHPSTMGQHAHAVLLDPISTRGSRVYLEFLNDSDQTIINPSAQGFVYEALQIASPLRIQQTPGLDAIPEDRQTESLHRYFINLYETSRSTHQDDRYFDRPVGIVRDVKVEDPVPADAVTWGYPLFQSTSPIQTRAAQIQAGFTKTHIEHFGTHILHDLPDGAKATVLLKFFPNLKEHLQLLHAANRRRIYRLVFQLASFEHDRFLSARDHARLADYEDLGVEVLWCNEDRSQLVVHRYRGRRGFFCELDKVDRFDQALLIAVYGSVKALPPVEFEKLKRLLAQFRDFFGPDVAIITGGGEGAMKQATDFGRSLDLLVGASYLEIEDQKGNPTADFYQCFQESCRHSRQRWFEIASFQIFCLGGLGTMEEVGMTLTDMKLNVVDRAPVIFFGRREDHSLYWENLSRQLQVIAAEGRGPEWLKTHVLMTDDADEVIEFYRRTLELG
ncbi:MAG: LOG family protein [Planctomycetota bacterium]|nr:LOG family protein [Planctomycetota bacterium]